MTRAALLARAREHERTALALHVEGRWERYWGRHGAADLAWQMRDVARRMGLEALADAEVAT